MCGGKDMSADELCTRREGGREGSVGWREGGMGRGGKGRVS